MIEIKPRPNGKYNEADFYIDGELIEQTKLKGRLRLDTGFFTFISKDTDISRKLLLYRPTDFAFNLEHGSFEYKTDNIPLLSRFSLSPDTKEIEDKSLPSGVRYIPINGVFTLTFTFQPNLAEWNRKYTFSEYCSEFIRYAKYIDLKKITFEAYSDETPFITHLEGIVSVEVWDFPFRDKVTPWLYTLASIHQSVERNLLPQSQNNSVVLTFDFPDAVKAPCEQYLVYFSEFLRDLGVQAVSGLDHKAGQVLFTVTPDNPDIALDKIRKALDIYLELPSSPIATNTQDADSRALMLSSEINTLKSRLDMAQFKALEQEKRLNLQEKLIQTQEESAAREHSILQQYLKEKFNPSILQNAFVDAEIIEETTMDVPRKQDLKEGEINLGLVKVEPIKIGGGIKVDTPKIVRLGVRNLKELFEKLDNYLNEK
ncbi:MAG TPA: hypothetical protein VF571_15405 [Pyrinomonadaceae bacterium]|jgi:hypothetical protein